MNTKIVKSRPEHQVTYQELVALVSRHAKELTAIEVLAVAANMIGKLMAMQDQRAFTAAMVTQIVADNIETGNQQAIAELQKTQGAA